MTQPIQLPFIKSQGCWCLLLLLLVAFSEAAISSSQTFTNLFDGETVDASLLDDSTQTLYVTATPTGFQSFFSLYKISSTGNRDYKVDIPFRNGRLTMNPTFVSLHDTNTLVVLANGGFSDPTINGGSDCTVYFVDASTGSVLGDFVTLTGPEFIENGQANTLLIATKVITSTADPNKIYVMAGSLMEINTAAYGYSIFKIDVPSRSIDWVNHYLPSGSDGATPSDILEVNSSYVLVAGFLGLFRYDLATGTRSDVLPNHRSNNLLLVNNNSLILVGAAGSDASMALDASSLVSLWSTPEGRGIVYHAPGPDSSTTVWFTKILIPEASQNWNVQVGVIRLSDGGVVWSQPYDGGSNLFDTVVGFHSLGTTAYLGTSGRQATQCCLANLFGLLPRATIGDARVLTVDHASQAITNQLVDTSIGAPRVFQSTDSLGWMISFDGSAIRYAYS